MYSPPITVDELLEENRRLRAQHAKELADARKSMRDHFASAAVQGFVMAHAIAHGPQWSAGQIAESSYLVADALLAERVKQPLEA